MKFIEKEFIEKKFSQKGLLFKENYVILKELLMDK